MFFKYIDLFLRKFLVPLNNLQIKKHPLESKLITELRNIVKSVKIPKEKDLVHKQWLGKILELRKQILTQNPKNFLQWEMIRSTMFIGNALFLLKEFIYLKQNNWKKWKKILSEKRFIFTEPYLFYPKTNGNLIHHAYHIARFEKITKKRVADFDFIFEYGGGYGGMCQLVHKLGFKGKYIIFDFPILSALQSFFLRMNYLNASSDVLNKKANILCLDNINSVRKHIPNQGKMLFIATWSLSESPLQIREKIYPLIKNFNSHLIAYQGSFNEVDNHKYFERYKKGLNKLHWWDHQITHLKDNHYLFGFK